MISSGPFPFKYKGQPAQLYIMRNNGVCWGRMVLKTGEEFDVSTARDHYDSLDSDAAVAFINKVRRTGHDGPAMAWPIGWQE